MTHHAESKKPTIRIINYLGEIINELKKVVWLTRREIIYLTLLVLVVSAAAAALLGGLDYGFAALVDKVFIAH